jgi:hypothetical protein
MRWRPTQRPGGPTAKRQPSPEGLGINPESDLSAVGAALNLGRVAAVPLGVAGEMSTWTCDGLRVWFPQFQDHLDE